MIQGADDPYGTTRQLDLIAAGVGDRSSGWCCPASATHPHLEAEAAC